MMSGIRISSDDFVVNERAVGGYNISINVRRRDLLRYPSLVPYYYYYIGGASGVLVC